MKNLFTKRVFKMTLVISLIHMLLLVLVSCLDETTLEDPFGERPPPRNANAIGLKNQFFPYENSRYSIEKDTVLYEKFGIVLELTPELLSDNQLGKFPAQALALSCAPSYNFRNISNISIILTAPFAGIQNGTDISYLLELPDKTRLSKLRDFKNTSTFFSPSLKKEPANFARLKTKTILFLGNGTQITLESTSPAIKTR